MWRAVFLAVLVVLLPSVSFAGGAYPYGEHDTVIGFPIIYKVGKDESLHEVARNFDLGYNEITAANPDVDPWAPGEGTEITVPSSWILPDDARGGIVINLAEMRLFHYLEANGARLVRTYPVGVGTEGFETPTGPFRITHVIKDPAWYVPKSIRGERPGMPAVVPPGDEENPLGSYALRLSEGGYLIHGTNMPYGVGRRVSHGCIRLYPEDIVGLAAEAGPGTSVLIVYQPVKTGLNGGDVYVEVEGGYAGDKDYETVLRSLLDRYGDSLDVDIETLKKALRDKTGVPVSLGPAD